MTNPEEEPKKKKETKKPGEQPPAGEQPPEGNQSEENVINEEENSGSDKPNEKVEKEEVNSGEEERAKGGERKEQDQGGQKQDLRQQIQEDLNGISKEFLEAVDGLKLRKLIEQIEARVRNENPHLQPNEKDSDEEKNSKELSLKNLVEAEVLRALEAIKGELRAAFNQIMFAGDENQLKRFTGDLLFKIDKFKGQNLTEEEAERLKKLVGRLENIKRLSFEHSFGTFENRFRLEFSDLERELGYFNISLTERSKNVALALYNVDNFIDFLKKEGYLDNEGRFKAELFLNLYNEIRELFEEVISMVDTKPGQYFDNAFSPMYEQAYYNRLVHRLRIIGEEIRKRYPNIGETLISIDDPQILRYGYDPERGAESRMSYPGFRRGKFDYVIGVVLAQDMSRLLNIHRVLHNAELVVDEGHGWEELAKYIEQLSIEEVVWLFRSHPDLVKAYNLYLQNLIQEFALNNWVIPTSFGYRDRDNLDYAQRLTLSQLLAKLSAEKRVDQGTKEFYKTARVVRIASALAKSVTGEFWKILLTSKFLISEKETKKGVGIIEYLYTGAYHSGAEKMLSQIDIAASLERFNLPGQFPDIKYVYIPRDITKAKYEPWDHRRVYWVKKQFQDALVFGSSEEFLQFLKNNKLMVEALKKPTVDILDRAGWRVKEYQAFLRRTPDGKLDFNASMRNLAMVGTSTIRTFIMNLDFSEIDLNLINDEELKQALQNKDKDYLIRRYIFERLLSIRPSKVLTLEKRLYTPKGEDLVVDDLVAFFKKQYGLDSHLIKDKIFPLFLGGLELVEEIIYREKHDQARRQYYEEGSILQNELVFYELTKEDLMSDKAQRALENFYEMFVGRLGVVVNYHGKEIDTQKLISKDDFLEKMNEFFFEIKNSIQRPRNDVLSEKKGKQEVSLAQRFALWFQLGFLSGEINGEDLDYGEFLLTQAGRRVHARPFSDASSHAAKIFPNYLKIFDGLVTQLVKTKLGDANSVIEFTNKTLVPPAKEICDTLGGYAGKEEKDKTAIEIMMLLERIVGRDSRYRIIGLGDLVMTAARKMGKQGSLAQEVYPHHRTRPTYAHNADQMLTMAHAFLNAMNVPFEEEITIDYEEKPVLGGLYKKLVPKKEKNKYNVLQYDRIQGHSGWPRFKEKIIPIAAIIAAIVIIQLALSAWKKQSQKEN